MGEMIEKLILDIYKENDIYYEWDFINDTLVEINVEWGDWKHDHLYIKYLLEEKGFKQLSERVTEDDGSDTYSSIHIFGYYGKK